VPEEEPHPPQRVLGSGVDSISSDSKPLCRPLHPISLRGSSSAAAVSVAIVIGRIVHRVWPALSLLWRFNTDELAFYSESVRLLWFDPSQTFFDIPGTPYVALVSALTYSWWLGDRLFGTGVPSTPGDFAIANA
jgi:hypothetical protein